MQPLQKILMIEDLKLAQRLALEIFRKLNSHIEFASDSATACERIIFNHYDLIFIDIQLPDINGFELAMTVRHMERKNHIPIVAVTAHYLEDFEITCKKSGIDDFIIKPITIESVRHILRKYLHYDLHPTA